MARFHRVVLVAVLLVVPISGLVAKPKLENSWSAPDLKPTQDAKVLVLALVSDDLTKRSMEDAGVKALAARKVDAIAAYRSLTPADLANEQAIRAKAHELGVNAGLVFKATGVVAETQVAPSVSASVGVPVRVGMFSVFVGGSVPLGGGAKTVQKTKVKVEYYAADVEGARWMGSYAIETGGDAQLAAADLSNAAVKQLKKAGAIP